MITPKALAVCIFAAAQTYSVPPSAILGILNVEGGRIGQASPAADGTYDLGPTQINSYWVPKMAEYWKVSESYALQKIRDDACMNIGVAAWILRAKENETGSLEEGIARFRAAAHHIEPEYNDEEYRAKVTTASSRFRKVHVPGDLIASTSSFDKSDASVNQKHGMADTAPSSPDGNTPVPNNTSDNGGFGNFALSALVILAIVYLVKSRPPFDPGILTDTSRPEPERRLEIVTALIKKGWIVQNQQSGFVTAVKQKGKFDILAFIVLCCLAVFPGIVYLVYYATKRDKIQQYVLMQ